MSLLVVNIPLSKLANVIDFKAHFPVVSIIFRPLVCFKSWQNRAKVYDRVLPCIDRFGYDFRVL